MICVNLIGWLFDFALIVVWGLLSGMKKGLLFLGVGLFVLFLFFSFSVWVFYSHSIVAGGFEGDVVDDAVDAFDFVDDSV